MSLGASGIETLALIIVGATLLSFLARKLKQPTVTAYIVTGLILGSVGLGIVSPNEITKLLSELGLAFLLFLIGLEINLEDIKDILKPVTIISIVQISFLGIIGFLIASGLGFSFIESLFIAGASMFSSTAVVVKILADKDEASSLPGKIDIGILLIQDLVVILLLVVVKTGGTNLAQLTINILEVLAMIGVLGIMTYLSSRFFLPKLFKQVAENKHSFFVHSVGWAFLLITVSTQLGISSEIGAFLAGIALGQIPYSSEIRERVRPLTDFFMAVFFVNIGLNLTSSSLTIYWKEAMIASGLLMVSKFVVIFLMTDRMKFTPETSFKTSINMSQISEFSLILGSLGVSQGLISEPILGFLSLIAISTMGISSYFITYNNEIYTRFEEILESFNTEEKTDIDTSELKDHAVLIGYDDLSKNLLNTIDNYFETIVIIDRAKRNVQELASSNYEFIYGDLKHPEIREAARIEYADLIISLAPKLEHNKKVLDTASKTATKFVKAKTIEEAGELYEKGAHYVIIENIITGKKMGERIKTYLEDPEEFINTIEPEKQRINYWRRENNG